MKNTIIILILIAVISACKKGSAEFIITGVVTDMTFNQPLSNVTVKVSKTAVNSGEGVHFTTVTTDSEGKYSLSVSRDRFISLQLLVEKEGYFTITETVLFSDLSVKSDNHLNLSTTGKSWARIILKHNESPDTKLDIVRTKGKSACAECCPDGYQQFVGITDTSFYCINDANTLYEITYFKQLSSFNGTKSEVTPFMDTVEILLNY